MAKRKQDGLYRRGGVFGFRFKDASGAWKEKLTSCSDREAAKEFKRKFLEDVKNGTLPTGMAEWTLTQARDWWLEYRKPRIAKGSWLPESYRLKPMIAIVGDIKLKQLDCLTLDKYVTARLEQTIVRRGHEEKISHWSVNKEVLAWSLILKKAKLWRRIAEDYRPLKTQAGDIGRALSREQLRHLAEVAATDVAWEAAFYGSVLAANTGLRGGEVKKLRIGQVDLEHRRLSVAQAKTDAGVREVMLNADATEAAARLMYRASTLKPPATGPDHYLLPKNLSRIQHGANKGSHGYDPNQPQVLWDSAWTSLTKAAGLAPLRFHDLRHTFVTHMVERGVPIAVIQSMVGHMSAKMVRHYTHVSSGAARAAVELLDKDSILTPVNVATMTVGRTQ